MRRPWAFWRRVQYGTGAGLFVIGVMTLIYFVFFYTPPSCFDGKMNGSETGVDCGGACQKVCAADVAVPVERWVKAFRITDGLYNVVAYVENRNFTVGTEELPYTFTLVDKNGDVITERSGATVLPPDSVYPIFEGRVAVGDRVPARAFIDLHEVTEWKKMTDRREQFFVSDRQLINVDSQPRLDTVISNTALEDEFDVEIIATIFDAQGNALTASRSVVPRFDARAEERVVFTWPEPIAKTLRSCEVPTDVIVAIDLSGSMNDDGGDPPEPISSVLSAAEGFVNRLRNNDQSGVVTFATNADLVRNLSTDLSGTAEIISGLSIAPKEEVGSTNIGDPILFATEEFSSPRHNRNARKILVLLTDGKANAPDENAEEYALEAAANAKAEDVDIFAIGLGENVNVEFLTELATEPDKRYLAASTKDLDEIYRSISTAICEEGPAVIDIVPKVIGSL